MAKYGNVAQWLFGYVEISCSLLDIFWTCLSKYRKFRKWADVKAAWGLAALTLCAYCTMVNAEFAKMD